MEPDEFIGQICCYLKVGRRGLNLVETKPSLWWSTKCSVTEPHPLLDCVTELDLRPQGGRISLGSPGELNIDLFKKINYVYISGAYKDDQLWREHGPGDVRAMALWMKRRAEEGKRMEGLDIDDSCHPDLKAAAWNIREAGLVDEVYLPED
jgi:hypothetical protein